MKIDRHFIDGIHLDAVKREFVGSMLQMAKASRAVVIAEGIELQEELAVLIDMGVDLVQGYLLCRPQEHPPHDAHVLLPQVHTDAVAPSEASRGLSALLKKSQVVTKDMPTATALSVFRNQADLSSLAVLNASNQPIGILRRHALADVSLKSAATEVQALEPISRLMSEDFLVVELSQSLQQVSRLITSRGAHRFEEDFIITQNGVYLGLGQVVNVLRLITELTIQQPR